MCSESFNLLSSKIRVKMTTPSSRTTKNMWETDVLLLKAFIKCKTEPSSFFSHKTDIMWVVPLFTK